MYRFRAKVRGKKSKEEKEKKITCAGITYIYTRHFVFPRLAQIHIYTRTRLDCVLCADSSQYLQSYRRQIDKQTFSAAKDEFSIYTPHKTLRLRIYIVCLTYSRVDFWIRLYTCASHYMIQTELILSCCIYHSKFDRNFGAITIRVRAVCRKLSDHCPTAL